MNAKQKAVYFGLSIILVFLTAYVVAALPNETRLTQSVKSVCEFPFDCPDGVVKLGDRVIYFTDDNGDGFFEKNLAFVTDDINAVSRITNEPISFGNRINLFVVPSGETSRASPYVVRSATRGRRLGQYEALANANHH